VEKASLAFPPYDGSSPGNDDSPLFSLVFAVPVAQFLGKINDTAPFFSSPRSWTGLLISSSDVEVPWPPRLSGSPFILKAIRPASPSSRGERLPLFSFFSPPDTRPGALLLLFPLSRHRMNQPFHLSQRKKKLALSPFSPPPESPPDTPRYPFRTQQAHFPGRRVLAPLSSPPQGIRSFLFSPSWTR